LITGGAKRIGHAIALGLHRRQFNVVVHYRRSSAEADALCSLLNERQPDCAVAIGADLLEDDAVTGLAAAAVDRWGRIDALVNNASSFYPTPMGTIDNAHWLDLMGTNLKAPLLLTQALSDELARTEGCVVNLADIHGSSPLGDHSIYCAAKAGLLMLTKCLAKDLGPRIRVNAVSPGPILWPDEVMQSAEHQPSDAEVQRRSEIIHATALRRMGDPEDIARTVEFLICDAGYVTGQNLAVDGGRSL
jgi:pteridine reductase